MRYCGTKANPLPFEHTFFRVRWAEDNLSTFWNHLSDYSVRTLCYESDILDAFRGILGSLIGDNEQIDHFWGVLIGHEGDKWSGFTYSERFAQGLLWRVYNLSVPKRRVGFPSWSWASFAGHISGWEYGVRNPPIDIFVETEDRKHLHLDEFFQISRRDRPILTQNLLIRALVTPVHLIYSPGPGGRNGWLCNVNFTKVDGETLERPLFYLDSEDTTDQSHMSWLGVILGAQSVYARNRLDHEVLIVVTKVIILNAWT
jgi:hypothetical protein